MALVEAEAVSEKVAKKPRGATAPHPCIAPEVRRMGGVLVMVEALLPEQGSAGLKVGVLLVSAAWLHHSGSRIINGMGTGTPWAVVWIFRTNFASQQ